MQFTTSLTILLLLLTISSLSFLSTTSAQDPGSPPFQACTDCLNKAAIGHTPACGSIPDFSNIDLSSNNATQDERTCVCGLSSSNSWIDSCKGTCAGQQSIFIQALTDLMVSYKTYCAANASVTTTGSSTPIPSPTGGTGSGTQNGGASGGIRSVSSSSWSNIAIVILAASMISFAAL